MFGLTGEGKRNPADKRRHPWHPLNVAIEYDRADSKKCPAAFTLNFSEKGLLIDLGDKLEVGQNLKLRILTDSQEPIEIFARVVWINPPPEREKDICRE
jgi:Tfp pilus assembly protein PilZ